MLVLVYKYNFSEPDQLSEKVIGLIRIMINSLAAHVHICSKYAKTEGVGLVVRSQELSEASNGNGNVGPAGTLQVRVNMFLEFTYKNKWTGQRRQLCAQLPQLTDEPERFTHVELPEEGRGCGELGK